MRPAPALAGALLSITLVAAGCANDPMPAARSRPTATPRTDRAGAAATTTTATGVASIPRAAAESPPEADLYAAPPTVTGPPGTVLRRQRITTDTGPGTSWRIMYASTDRNGAPIPVTGTVRVPDGDRPDGGWPLVTWAHGTTGSADACAPSRLLHRGAADDLAADGIVVASTDYEGLGTPGLHPYLDGPSEGRATLDIVAAAGSLPGVELSGQVAIWGHSQGGHAALFARQMAAERLDGFDVVGTVAFAPPSNVAAAMTAILTALQPKTFGVLALAGIAATDPAADLRSVLTPQAAAAAEAVVDHACVVEVGRAMRAFGGDQVVVARPDQTSPWAERLAESEPAMVAGDGPLLLVHAADDTTVPAAMSATVKERTCARRETTQRWLAASGGHSGVVGDSWQAARRWTLDRFAGIVPDDGCGLADGPPP